MAYDINQKFISQNRSGKVLRAIGSVLHETADPGATDQNEFNYYNGGYRGASAHAFVDHDSIIQTIPWNEQAWHAGPTVNSTRIGIELCHYDDLARFNEVWIRAVWLFAWVHVNILKLATVTKDNLMSHAEVSAKWHETDHTDPVGYFAQFGKTVDDFRAALQQEINLMINTVKEEGKVKHLVVYGKKKDKPLAEVLAYKIGCPVMDADIPFDYSVVERPIAVGGTGNLPWSSYIKQEDILTGKDYDETLKLVENFKL